MAKIISSKKKVKPAPKKAKPNKPKLKLFSYKELHIMKLISEELNSNEIAEKLNTTTKAIHAYREHIMVKTGSKNVVGIVKYSIRNRIFILK